MENPISQDEYRVRFAVVRGDHCAWLYDDADGSLTPLADGAETIENAIDGHGNFSAALSILETTGRLEAETVGPPDLRTKNRIANLKLALSNRCPAACSYCFRSQEESAPAPIGIASKALNAIADDFGASCDLIVVAYNLTSEPLADLPALEELLAARIDVEARTGKTVNVYLCTSGTVRVEKALALAESALRGYRLALSVDGPQEVHDRHRRDAAGRGTFAGVMEVLRWAEGRKIPVEAQAVLTRDFPHPDVVVDYLLDLGFSSVTAKPVRPGASSAFSLADLPPLLASWDRLFARLDRELAAGDGAFLDAVKHDYWLKPLWKIALGVRSGRRCFWGTTHIVVDAKGDFYPCDVVIGNPEARCGSLDEGMDWTRFHRELSVDLRSPCGTCWARHLCGGTCYAVGLLQTGDPRSVESVECAMSRHLVSKCLELAARYVERGNSLRSLGRRLLTY